jgi:negative regulator of genetic competence, sporulation and motility
MNNTNFAAQFSRFGLYFSRGSFAKAAKQHDDSKKTGRIANIFEKKEAEASSAEAKAQAEIELRRASKQVKEAEQKEKAQKAAALAKFNASLASRAS